VKFGLVLYRDPGSNAPTTYVMSRIRVGVSNDRQVNEGTWSIGQGMALDPDATVYRLDTARIMDRAGSVNACDSRMPIPSFS